MVGRVHLQQHHQLRPGAWNHVAATYDGAAYRIYVNGQLMHTESQIAGVPLTASPLWTLGQGFAGQMVEVRIWNVARTQNEIRDNMNRPLTGNEPHLVSLWNFENVINGIIKDQAHGGHDGRLVGAAKIVSPSAPVRAGTPTCELSGTITDSTGNPATNAVVLLSQDGTEVRRTVTDANGAYSFAFFEAVEGVDLTAKFENEAVSQTGLSLALGDRRQL